MFSEKSEGISGTRILVGLTIDYLHQDVKKIKKSGKKSINYGQNKYAIYIQKIIEILRQS